MSQNRTSLIGAVIEPDGSLVWASGFVVWPIDMIRRPSDVTATQFKLGLLDSSVVEFPCRQGIFRKSRPSAVCQTKMVASSKVPATSRDPSGVNARHATPSRMLNGGAIPKGAGATLRPGSGPRREVPHRFIGRRDPPERDGVAARAGHERAVGREPDVADRTIMERVAKEEPIAGQVPERHLAAVLAPEQLRSVG